MSKGCRKKRRQGKATQPTGRQYEVRLRQAYRRACQLAESGQHEEAGLVYEELDSAGADRVLKALIGNDLAVLAVMRGDTEAARRGLQAALAIDGECELARANLALLGERPDAEPGGRCAGSAAAVQRASGGFMGKLETYPTVRVAILSFLFNWPSTGGGIVHTVELARFMA
jgi:hypothetical protein